MYLQKHKYRHAHSSGKITPSNISYIAAPKHLIIAVLALLNISGCVVGGYNGVSPARVSQAAFPFADSPANKGCELFKGFQQELLSGSLTCSLDHHWDNAEAIGIARHENNEFSTLKGINVTSCARFELHHLESVARIAMSVRSTFEPVCGEQCTNNCEPGVGLVLYVALDPDFKELEVIHSGALRDGDKHGYSVFDFAIHEPIYGGLICRSAAGKLREHILVEGVMICPELDQ